MKRNLLSFVAATVTLISIPSCTTTYDAHGRPVQSVDPGTAAAGAAAAGVAGYAIGRNQNSDRKSYHRNHYHRRPYRR